MDQSQVATSSPSPLPSPNPTRKRRRPRPTNVAAAAAQPFGVTSIPGSRGESEDAVTSAPGFVPDFDFFGVFDGHGGARVSETCRERMHDVVAEEMAGKMEGELEWGEVMGRSFGRVDDEVVEEERRGDGVAERTVGSTAVVALVGKEKIVVANCGDSRAVLCRDGVAVPLSVDHKPNRPDELERIEAAGGRVINWLGHRVSGVLATSRSIGDYYLKPYVISEPEVTVTDRSKRDEFLILASDGLWDVVSNEAACTVVRQCLTGKMARMFPESVTGCSATEAAAVLAKLAVCRGSKDDISVIIVQLKQL